MSMLSVLAPEPVDCVTKEPSMKFSQVAQTFEIIEAESSRTAITQQLADLFASADEQEIGIICNLSLGLLRPSYKGTQFNVAEKTMVSIVAQTLDIADETVKRHAKQVGDLGLVVQEGNWQPEEELTVNDVYKALCAIENISGTGSVEEKAQAISQLLSELDPLSAKYVVRIILGKLRLGFSDMTIVDALSWMQAGDKSLRKRIEQAYNNCADISIVASTLKAEGIEAIDTMNPRVGTPIRPSAAERMPTAQALFEKLGPCVAQPKLDGFRLQVHVDNTGKQPKVHFFSRNLLDMSYMFPDLVDALKTIKADTLICEGEAIVFDPHTGNFLPFQETVKRKRKHGIEEAVSEFPLQLYLFDILYLNGTSYLDKTHTDRRTALEKLFASNKDGRVQVIEEKQINSEQELQTYFVENIAAGLEGLVVKKPDSKYEAGKRNFNWIKFKRQEEGRLEDTVDVVILGYYAGKGKRSSFGIGAFLVGVYNPDADRFETVAKIGTGLKDEEWKELKHKLDVYQVASRPVNVTCPKELYPDVWVSLELVCLVRADEITLSPLHTAGKTDKQLGYALRFPRIMGYRTDKAPEDATTPAELDRLYNDQFAKKKKK